MVFTIQPPFSVGFPMVFWGFQVDAIFSSGPKISGDRAKWVPWWVAWDNLDALALGFYGDFMVIEWDISW